MQSFLKLTLISALLISLLILSQTIQKREHLLDKQEESPEKLQILAQTQDIQGRLYLVREHAEEALASWEKAEATYDRVRAKVDCDRRCN
jgi:hypothetical protein